MNKQALSLAMFVAGGVYPAVSNALSLGDIESNSNLNQPLKAQIELLSTNAQEAQQLQVRLAPPSVFNRVGIDRPAYLESLRFSTTIRNGKPVIVVSSDVPIDEPFVNFLVEVSWPQGQLLKEYTVMLDPPVLMQPGNTSTAEATVRAEPSAGGRVARPAPQQAQPQPTRVTTAPQQPRAAQPQPVQRERVAPRPVEAQPQPIAQAQPQPAQAQQPARPARRTAANRTYRVRAGDTLYGIAEKARPRELTTDQMMMALYRANPNAFIRNNINGLKRGAVLRAPTMEAAKSVAPTNARQQVRQQHADWKEFRSRAAATTVAQEGNNATRTPATNAAQTTKPTTPQQPDKPNTKPRLEVLGGNQEATPSNNATAAAGQARLQELEKQLSLTRESISARQRENTELRSRLSDLESMLEKKNRLVAMGNSQMTDLQNSLGNNANSNTTTSTPRTNGTGTVVNSIPAQPNTSTATQLPSMQAGVAPNPTTPTLPNNGTLPNVGAPTTANGTVLPPVTPTAEGANLQQTVGNMAANQNNTINRTVPPVNQGSVTPTNTPKPNEVKPTPAFTDETAEGNDLLSMLTSPLALQIGAGSLLGLLGLGLLWRFLGRRRQKVVNNDAIFDLEDDIADPTKGEKLHGADVFANLEDEIKHAEQRHDVPMRGAAVGAGSTKTTDTTLDTKHTAPSEEDDVLMESNVYIAYGLHQQAESELKKAIEKHPQRLEYRHKLLENYFAANNRAAFDQTAQEFMAQSGVNKQRLWDDIVVWGRKISPDNPLYAANTSQTITAELGLGANRVATTAGAAAASIGAVAVASAALKADDDDFDDYDLDLPDLDLPQVSNQLKADLAQNHLSHPNLTANTATKTEDLAGINLTKADKETTYSAPTINQITDELDDFDFDLDFDEPKLPTATLKTDVPRPTASSMLDELDSLDFDTDPLPVVEPKTPEKGIVNLFDELDLAGDTVANKAQQVADQAGSALNATVTAAGQGLDALGGKVSAAATAAVAGAGALAAGALNAASNSKPTQAADQALDEFDELDDADYSALDDLLREHNLTLADSAMDTNKAALVTNTANVVSTAKPKVTDLELHIKDNDLNKILPENNFYTKSANSASNVAPVNATTATEEEWLGDIDDALSFLDLPDEEIDLHEAHISTKLDLARAYLDMGDIEGARSTLEEVVVEGNDDQRREAQQLLHQAG